MIRRNHPNCGCKLVTPEEFADEERRRSIQKTTQIPNPELLNIAPGRKPGSRRRLLNLEDERNQIFLNSLVSGLGFEIGEAVELLEFMLNQPGDKQITGDDLRRLLPGSFGKKGWFGYDPAREAAGAVEAAWNTSRYGTQLSEANNEYLMDKMSELLAAIDAYLVAKVKERLGSSDEFENELNTKPGTAKRLKDRIPKEEYEQILTDAFKNPDSDTMTMGKFEKRGPNYYTVGAGNTSYFDMGDNWNKIQIKYGFTDNDMFELFNISVIDAAIMGGKILRFTHNPINDDASLGKEWNYIKTTLGITDKNLVQEGDFWYVIP